MAYREVLTPAEERFERLRRMSGFFLGPFVFLSLESELILEAAGAAPCDRHP